MTYKALLIQKLHVESLLLANLKALEQIKSYSIDQATLDEHYRSGRALAAQHMEILNQLERR